MKLAVGLFHFNPHWNADSRSAHRHCTESFAPFLNAVRANTHWKVSIEISGSGLQFIQEAYPELIRLLRSLINDGRVELISALYTPSIWVAFPRRDLLTSISMNRLCLEELKLPQSRIFFAQEAFFGGGAACLAELFDFAVCKDDYLAYYYDIDFTNPVFSLEGFRVMVSSNHLLNEIREAIKQDPDIPKRFHLRDGHLAHLNRTTELHDPTSFPASRGTIRGTEWLWYHCGDGNHFGTIHKPDDLERCYYDPIWSALCVNQIESYHEQGYCLATIGELFSRFDYSVGRELPPLVEGAWNPKKSRGLLCWMGANNTAAEDDAAVLSSISRARARLLTAERAMTSAGHTASVRSRLDEAWKLLLHAQISDALGWSAGPQAVQYSLSASEQALIAANQILGDNAPGPVASLDSILNKFEAVRLSEACTLPTPEIFGAEGEGSYTAIAGDSHVYECTFRAIGQERRCGVRFPFEMDDIVYCPSGMEKSPIRIPLRILKPSIVTLPLANGLVQIATGVFLIKDVSSVHVAACIQRDDGRVEFAIEGARHGKIHTWRFYLVHGSIDRAIACANLINSADLS
jgi:hypothetical protein